MRRGSAERTRDDKTPAAKCDEGPVSAVLRTGRADDPSRVVGTGRLDRKTLAFYRDAILLLQAADVPFLVGGAYALACYVGVTRHTRDFDVFVRRHHVPAALEALARAGCKTEVAFPHWLGKALRGGELIDVIFSSGNGVANVDDVWFERAVEAKVFGLSVRLVPPEEIIWSKAFIMERERYDGADVAHLLHALGDRLDWQRLIDRFGPHWRVLLAHVVLHGFIYPDEHGRIPAWVEDELVWRLANAPGRSAPLEVPHRASPNGAASANRICNGTLLSRAQYLVDVGRWGYCDGRAQPHGPMSEEDIEVWTAAIAKR